MTSRNGVNAEFYSPPAARERRCKAVHPLQHRKTDGARQAHCTRLFYATRRIARSKFDNFAEGNARDTTVVNVHRLVNDRVKPLACETLERRFNGVHFS